MNYAYNINVNLKKKLYNFYEWSKEDKLEYFDKLNIFVVDDKTYNDILKMNVKVNNSFLDLISINKLTCIFTNDIDTICVRFNKDGNIELISKLDLEEENEILDEINFKNKYKLDYKIINYSNNYSYNTREEEKIINSLNKYIEQNKDNEELIDYLYNEWFNEDKEKNKYNKLLNTINDNYSFKHKELYDLIKLIA